MLYCEIISINVGCDVLLISNKFAEDPAVVHTHNMPKAPLASLFQQAVHDGAFHSL